MIKSLNGSVLLVEDSPATINYNKRLIKRNGISNDIETVFNGEEAINYLLKVENELFPRLILLDLNMPLLDGVGFLSKYNQLIPEDKRKDTMIVFLSTSKVEEDVERLKTLIKNPFFLTKPLTKEKLNQVIETYFLTYRNL